MNNTEDEDDELSMLRTPMMRVGSTRRENLQPRMASVTDDRMTDDRTDGSEDELGE